MKWQKLALINALFIGLFILICSAARADSRITGTTAVTTHTGADKVIADGGKIYLSSVNISDSGINGDATITTFATADTVTAGENARVGLASVLMDDTRLNGLDTNTHAMVGDVTARENGRTYIAAIDLSRVTAGKLTADTDVRIDGPVTVSGNSDLNVASVIMADVTINGDAEFGLNANVKSGIEVSGDGSEVMVASVRLGGGGMPGQTGNRSQVSNDTASNPPASSDHPGNRPWEFSPDDIVNYRPPKAGSRALRNAMQDLSQYMDEHRNELYGYDMNNPPDKLVSLLNSLADAWGGMDRDEARNQYKDYLAWLRKHKMEIPKKTMWSDHYGSLRQLRFGKIVGDNVGLNPVFGALLSPTGGITGPGDVDLEHMIAYELKKHNLPAFKLAKDRSEILHFHAVTHDAAGFLNQADIGPGYRYNAAMPSVISDHTRQFITLGGEWNFLEGHISGIAGFWLPRIAAGNAKKAVVTTYNTITAVDKYIPSASIGTGVSIPVAKLGGAALKKSYGVSLNVDPTGALRDDVHTFEVQLNKKTSISAGLSDSSVPLPSASIPWSFTKGNAEPVHTTVGANHLTVGINHDGVAGSFTTSTAPGISHTLDSESRTILTFD